MASAQNHLRKKKLGNDGLPSNRTLRRGISYSLHDPETSPNASRTMHQDNDSYISSTSIDHKAQHPQTESNEASHANDNDDDNYSGHDSENESENENESSDILEEYSSDEQSDSVKQASRRDRSHYTEDAAGHSDQSADPDTRARTDTPSNKQKQLRALQHTISDDRSCQKEVQERFIKLAFRSEADAIAKKQAFLTVHNSGSLGSNNALQDYQMQLMLLEQQNKKRLMLERQSSNVDGAAWRNVAGSDAAHQSAEMKALDFTPVDIPNPLRKDDDKPGSSISTSRVHHNSSPSWSTANLKPNSIPNSTSMEAKPGNHEHNNSDERGHVDLALQILSDALGIDKHSTLSLNDLQTLLVESKNPQATALTFRYQVIHRVSSLDTTRFYLDTPQWVAGAKSSRDALMGNLPIPNPSEYLSKHPDICCVIYREYDTTRSQNKDLKESTPDVPYPKHTKERIEATTELLATVVSQFYKCQNFQSQTTLIETETELTAPYTIVYHNRNRLAAFADTLDQASQSQFNILLNYIFSHFSEEYNLVDEMTSQGKIFYKHLTYLYQPGDIVVKTDKAGIMGYWCESWLSETVSGLPLTSILSTSLLKQRSKVSTSKCSLSCWSWTFDGKFARRENHLSLAYDSSDTSAKAIKDLEIVPLKYLSESNKARLRQRGEWIWKCRVRCLISYAEEPNVGALGSSSPTSNESTHQERYMVDMMMYRELHKNSAKSSFPYADRTFFTDEDELEPEVLQCDNPPDNGFVYLTPATIKGYNFKRKRWLELKVDQIRDVVWDKAAFNSLVIKEKTKRLIRAFISNHIEAERSTDLISGKGNGLILLLHGGPGTGKTLTAESVAEIAERPLYPVTCGDIGTEPEAVEDYLESVLHIGKTWGCVVLLDEADVFLEQRSLEDLRRNALVSVFLRVLEYYEGILILTSNRVGTFDEAFKSRIQLAIHYQNLDLAKRIRIWGNFITRLEYLQEEAVDFADLKDNIDKLATNKMNGREIRNVITTARQYVRWERQQPGGESLKLNYAVMNDIIETAGEFNQYILDVKGGMSNDEIAAEDGLRVAVAD